MARLLEEFIQFLIIWFLGIFIMGIFLNQIVVTLFSGQWILAGLVFALGFYILFKGLLNITQRA